MCCYSGVCDWFVVTVVSVTGVLLQWCVTGVLQWCLTGVLYGGVCDWCVVTVVSVTGVMDIECNSVVIMFFRSTMHLSRFQNLGQVLL